MEAQSRPERLLFLYAMKHMTLKHNIGKMELRFSLQLHPEKFINFNKIMKYITLKKTQITQKGAFKKKLKLLLETVFKLNKIKEAHKIPAQGLQERMMFFFQCNYCHTKKNVGNTVLNKVRIRKLFTNV